MVEGVVMEGILKSSLEEVCSVNIQSVVSVVCVFVFFEVFQVFKCLGI